MPKFRFTVVDATGQERSGTIEAASEADVATTMAQRGLRVLRIAPAYDSSPGMAIPRSRDEPAWAPAAAAARPPGRFAIPPVLPLAFSCAAVLFSFAALLINLSSGDPLGKGIAAYDFSTPETAARSILQIDANGDVRAKIELGHLSDGGDPHGAAKTMEVVRVVDYQGTKVVFARYAQGGKTRRRVFTFEKDLATKLWRPNYLSSYRVRDTDEQLAKEMSDWTDPD